MANSGRSATSKIGKGSAGKVFEPGRRTPAGGAHHPPTEYASAGQSTPRPAQARSREHRDVRRDQILGEAIRLAGERGYYGLTLQEVAQRCGVTNAGLVYYFGSKDQLLLDMLQEFERRETAAMTPLVALATREARNSELAVDALLDVLRTMVARVGAQPEMAQLYTVLQAETLNPDHPGHASFRAREAATLNLFATLVSTYVDDPQSTARQLLALMDGLKQQWVREDSAFDLVVEWDRAIATVLPGLARACAGRNIEPPSA